MQYSRSWSWSIGGWLYSAICYNSLRNEPKEEAEMKEDEDEVEEEEEEDEEAE